MQLPWLPLDLHVKGATRHDPMPQNQDPQKRPVEATAAVTLVAGRVPNSSRLAPARLMAALIRRVEYGREHTGARGTLFHHQDVVLVMPASLR